MAKKQNSTAAATKTDLHEAIQGLESRLEVKLEQKLEAKLEQKLEAKLEQKLDEKLGGIRRDILRLMSESVATNGRMQVMEDRIVAKLDKARAEDIALRESFVAQMETLRRETITFPAILDEHGRRLSALEARRAP